MTASSWAEAQRDTHRRNWPGVERLLRTAPPHLFRQAKLLEYDLGISSSETGRASDAFTGPGQMPLASIPAWLFRDLGVAAVGRPHPAEGPLFRAACLLAARSWMADRILAGDTFYGPEHVALALWVDGLATAELAGAVEPGSAFWRRWAALRTDEMELVLEARDLATSPHLAGASDAVLRGRWSGASRTTAHAAAAAAGREDVALPLGEVLSELAAGLGIGADVATLPGDLASGRVSYPIALTAERTGIPLQPWPHPDVLLGALVVSRTLDALRQAALAHFDSALTAARDLGLPTFAAFSADARAGFEERLGPLGAGGRAPTRTAAAPKPAGSQAPAPAGTPRAVAMAAGFLLADATFKESWESHREGMFSADLVESPFPAALVLEVLAGHGHDLAVQADHFLHRAVERGFRYFDHPDSGVDTDTLGAYLRLLRYATDPVERLAAAAPWLACLERNVGRRGSIPVWLDGCVDVDAPRPPVLDLGEGCGTVAAHLALGLCELPASIAGAALETGASDLLDRIAAAGLAVNLNYPPLYALGVYLRLVARVEDGSHGASLARRADHARAMLHSILETAARARVVTAQHAALLVAACIDAGRPELLDERWLDAILRQQRFDGSWAGEPFFAAPNRGRSVTWYASTTLTSAFCYDAIVRSSAMRSSGPGLGGGETPERQVSA